MKSDMDSPSPRKSLGLLALAGGEKGTSRKARRKEERRLKKRGRVVANANANANANAKAGEGPRKKQKEGKVGGAKKLAHDQRRVGGAGSG